MDDGDGSTYLGGLRRCSPGAEPIGTRSSKPAQQNLARWPGDVSCSEQREPAQSCGLRSDKVHSWDRSGTHRITTQQSPTRRPFKKKPLNNHHSSVSHYVQAFEVLLPSQIIINSFKFFKSINFTSGLVNMAPHSPGGRLKLGIIQLPN
jgi:hypothetical protein